MKLYRHIMAAIAALMVLCAVTSCINDDFTTSSTDKLSFSVDTLKFDTVITTQGSPTKQFVVYNKAKKNIRISSIRVAEESEGHFSLTWMG